MSNASFLIADRALLTAPAQDAGHTGARAAGIVLQFDIVRDLDSLADEWRAFAQVADCTPFQSYDWVSAWYAHIGAPVGVRPAILTWRGTGGRLQMLAPLAVEQTRFGRRLIFLGQKLNDYNAPLLAPGLAKRLSADDFIQLWSAALGLLRQSDGLRFDLIHLNKMPLRVGAQANPLTNLSRVLHPSGAYMTSLGRDWESFYVRKRSSTTRRRDRGKLKKLALLGEPAMRTARTAAEAEAILGTLFEQKSKWFRRAGVPDLFATQSHRAFFEALVSGPSNLTHVSRFAIGETSAATNLGLLFRGCYFHILASYDDGPTSRLGAGAAHLHRLMAYAIGRSCSTFDFTIGDEHYKTDWADTRIDLYDHCSGYGPHGVLAAMATALAIWAKRQVKSSPLLFAIAGRSRTFIKRWICQRSSCSSEAPITQDSPHCATVVARARG